MKRYALVYSEIIARSIYNFNMIGYLEISTYHKIGNIWKESGKIEVIVNDII